MATVGNNYIGLADLFKRQDGKGQIATIIEMLAKKNSVLSDAITVECNDGTSHLTTTRSGLPGSTWRKLYQGVSPGKSQTTQVRDATGMLEAWSEVDSKLVELSKSPNELRLSEAKAFLQSMNNTMAETLFYGNTDAHPERFMGLAPRFSSLSADNAGQIVNAGGSGADNTSIWFCTWGEDTLHLIYPEGTKAGLQREDKGKQTKTLSDGSIMDVHREKFTWDLGLSLRDWRNVSRVANIDVSDLSKDVSTGAELADQMLDAYYNLENVFGADGMTGDPDGQTVIYANRTIAKFLHKQALNKTNVNLTIEQVNGKHVTHFLGIPVRIQDSILNTESAVA